jgi:hypothetical protein
MSEPVPTTVAGAVPQRPAPHPAVETAYLAPEAVLYDDRTGTVVHLNGSAAAIWMLMDGTLDLDGLVAELAEAFETEADRLRPDVESGLASFAAQGLIVEGPPAE